MYLTAAELLDFLPPRSAAQLTCDEHGAAEPNMERVTEAVRAAEELADGYLRGRYALPLSPVPTIMRDLVRTIARFKLYERRPESAMPETVLETYRAAIKTLENIRNGRVTLGVQSPASGIAAGGTASGDSVAERGEHRLSAPKTYFSREMQRAYEES